MKWRGVALACIALLVACGGGEESDVDTAPAKQAVLEATTTVPADPAVERLADELLATQGVVDGGTAWSETSNWVEAAGLPPLVMFPDMDQAVCAAQVLVNGGVVEVAAINHDLMDQVGGTVLDCIDTEVLRSAMQSYLVSTLGIIDGMEELQAQGLYPPPNAAECFEEFKFDDAIVKEFWLVEFAGTEHSQTLDAAWDRVLMNCIVPAMIGDGAPGGEPTTPPTCPDGQPCLCIDVDGSCSDGDDDWGYKESGTVIYFCSGDSPDYAEAMGGQFCPSSRGSDTPGNGYDGPAASEGLCAENEQRVATALASMDPYPATPTDFADTMRAAGDYMAWLADELPVELQPNAASLNAAYLAELADAFDGKDDFRGGLPELEDLDQKFESEWDDTPMEPMISFLMACGSGYDDVFVAVAADEAWGSLEEAIDEADADYDAIGEDDELDGYDPYGEGGDDFVLPEYEGDLPDAPEGFCVSLENQAVQLSVDLMPLISSMEYQEPSIEQMAGLFTAVDPLYMWLVGNVPAELTADVEAVRSQITGIADALSAIDPETATEEEIMMAMFMAMMGDMGEDMEELALAGLRLDTFLSRSCGVGLGEGPFGILEGFGDDDLYGEGGDEGDLPDAPEGFCVDLEGQVADLRADLMFVVDDIDGEAELEAFVYTAMVPLDDWLVENVPAELTADAEVVRSFFAGLSARFAEATTEDDFYAALAEPPGDVWALDRAGLRLDAFLDQSCGMTMFPDGAFGLADELVYDDYYEDDAPPPTTVPAKQTVLTTTTAP